MIVSISVSATTSKHNERNIHRRLRRRTTHRRRASTTNRGDLSLSIINVDGLEAEIDAEAAEKKNIVLKEEEEEQQQQKINDAANAFADLDAAFEEEQAGIYVDRMLQASSMSMRMLLKQTQSKEEEEEEETHQQNDYVDIEEANIYGEQQRMLQSMSMRMRVLGVFDLTSSMSM